MPVLAFPGPAAPSPPSVTVEVPEGWDALPAGSDLLRARGTGAAGEPVEVTVRSHTGPVGYAATDLVDALADGVTRPGTEVEPSFVVEIGGREWVARNISWDESSGPVVEVHLAAVVDGARPRHDDVEPPGRRHRPGARRDPGRRLRRAAVGARDPRGRRRRDERHRAPGAARHRAAGALGVGHRRRAGARPQRGLR